MTDRSVTASPRSVRLGRPTRLALAVAGIGVWLSGGLWLLSHYLLVEQGEFGPQANAWEPWWLKLHGAFAFATIWLFGLLWGVHVAVAWPLSQRRFSGGALAGIFVWLTAGGYLLYYAGDDTVRSVVSILHWGIGLASPMFYAVHRLNALKRGAGNGLHSRQGSAAALSRQANQLPLSRRRQ